MGIATRDRLAGWLVAIAILALGPLGLFAVVARPAAAQVGQSSAAVPAGQSGLAAPAGQSGVAAAQPTPRGITPTATLSRGVAPAPSGPSTGVGAGMAAQPTAVAMPTTAGFGPGGAGPLLAQATPTAAGGGFPGPGGAGPSIVLSTPTTTLAAPTPSTAGSALAPLSPTATLPAVAGASLTPVVAATSAAPAATGSTPGAGPAAAGPGITSATPTLSSTMAGTPSTSLAPGTPSTPTALATSLPTPTPTLVLGTAGPAPVAMSASDPALQVYWGNVDPQYRYFNGPNFNYDPDWYYWRHLRYPGLFRAYAIEPVSLCNTYYYRWQNVFYCYTGGSFGPGTPGAAVIGPAIFPLPSAGGVLTPTGYAQQSYWGHVPSPYQVYYGPDYAYEPDWYAARHLNNSLLYRRYSFDPLDECASYYYRYENDYYCYTGVVTYSTGSVDYVVPVRYWADVDPQYHYYYGPDYGYDPDWYAYRHLRYPTRFRTYDYEPAADCGTYYYRYESAYYCYSGD